MLAARWTLLSHQREQAAAWKHWTTGRTLQIDSSEPPAETEGGVEAVDGWSGSPEPPAGTETEPDGAKTFGGTEKWQLS